MDKYTVAKIGIHGAKATVLESNDITMGLTGAVVQLIYDDDLWQGMRKKVTFRGTKKVDVLTDENVVELPWEVTTAKNVTVSIGITGVDADEKTIIPTVWATIGAVKDSPYGAYPVPGEPVPPEWAQVLNLIGTLSNLNTETKENLVAAINEVLGKVGSSGGSVDLSGYVKSVNGIKPDPKTGDVAIKIPDSSQNGNQGGFSQALRVAIYNLLMDAAYLSSGHEADKAALAELLTGGSVKPEEPDVPDEPVITYYTIEKILTNVSISNGAATVAAGAAYSATLTADAGYVLGEVAVTMGGVAVPVADGVINIASVTGNIVIVATAEAEAVGGYEWETGVPYDLTEAMMDGIQLVSGYGTEKANDTYVSTDYLNCFDADSICYADSISTVFFYDANKNYISNTSSRVVPAIVAVPDGAVYARLTCSAQYWKSGKVVPIAQTQEVYTPGDQDVERETGRLDANTGSEIDASGSRTDYICIAGAKCLYTPDNNAFAVVCFYDVNRTFIGGKSAVMQPVDLIADYPGISYIRVFEGPSSRTIILDESAVYTPTRKLTQVSYTNANKACSGKPYTDTLTAKTGYTLDGGTVSVTMGGVDITETAYNAATGEIYIENVTGDIAITATAVAVTE